MSYSSKLAVHDEPPSQNQHFLGSACAPLGSNPSPHTMSNKRKYRLISEREKWTLPFFKAFAGFCPFYSPSQFESGAALSHGLDLSAERQYRIAIIKYMFSVGGTELLLPLNTICIAILYFHKFFQSISIRAHDPYYVATACLFTAGKQEENRVRLDKCARSLHRHKMKVANHSVHPHQLPPHQAPHGVSHGMSHHGTSHGAPPPPNGFNHHQQSQISKSEMDRMCKRLAIAELLCTQINQFNYNVTLPFDYLLPIISQWKSVYCPHLTNLRTLKYVYCHNAYKFIKQSFYIPINLVVPPQKIAIVAMELSLRLNYAKYQKQQEESNKASPSKTCSSSVSPETASGGMGVPGVSAPDPLKPAECSEPSKLSESTKSVLPSKSSDPSNPTNPSNANSTFSDSEEYRYIDPPLQWFRIFDPIQNEQDLKDEVQLIALEIIGAVQDCDQFGGVQQIETLKHFRKSTLKMDALHKQLIEAQVHLDRKLKDGKKRAKHELNQMEKEQLRRCDRIQYPYNTSSEHENQYDMSSSTTSTHTHTPSPSTNNTNTNTNSNTTPNTENRKRPLSRRTQEERFSVQKISEISLAFNNQTVSPASLQPHTFLTAYPLQSHCFDDVEIRFDDEDVENERNQSNHRGITDIDKSERSEPVHPKSSVTEKDVPSDSNALKTPITIRNAPRSPMKLRFIRFPSLSLSVVIMRA